MIKAQYACLSILIRLHTFGALSVIDIASHTCQFSLNKIQSSQSRFSPPLTIKKSISRQYYAKFCVNINLRFNRNAHSQTRHFTKKFLQSTEYLVALCRPASTSTAVCAWNQMEFICAYSKYIATTCVARCCDFC